MPYVRRGAIRTWWESHGSGPPVVLVHGYTSNLRTHWAASGWLRRLARSHRVLALDVRGHGRSSKPLDVAAYDRRALARDVVGVLNAAGERRAAIFGYSMGAMIATQALVDHPGRFTAAVLGGMGAAWPDGNDCAAGARAERPVRDLQRSAAGLAWWLRYYNPLAMRALRQGAFHGQQPLPLERLGEIRVPVLIAVGSRDQFCPGTELAAERIPDARRVVFEGQTHHSTLSDPRFHAAVLEFLAES
jgi:pimeloyl-ACP methyl ester carboxylesterase